MILLGSSYHPHQEGPGRDDFRTQATEVLPGDAGWEIRGPEPEAGGAAGENQPPRPHGQESSAGAGDKAEGGEREGDCTRGFVGGLGGPHQPGGRHGPVLTREALCVEGACWAQGSGLGFHAHF